MNAAAKDAVVLLDLLAPGEPVTFQTFDDIHKPKDPRFTSILHGTLAQHRAKLAALNARGAGIFWMVNAGDGKGREARNVQRIRALFVDLDGAPLEPVQSAPLAPHAIVESSRNRWHAYWRVSDCSLPDFKPMQKALAARFHSDASVCGLPNVLRLPGFVHQKPADKNGHDGKPFQSRIFQLCEAPPYSLAAFRDAFGNNPTEETEAADVSEVSEVYEVSEDRERGGTGKLQPERFLPSAPGNRNKWIFRYARHVKARRPHATHAELVTIAHDWLRLALPHIGTTDPLATEADLIRAYEDVKFPEGIHMATMLEGVERDPLPDGVPARYSDSARLLVRICARLQRAAGDDAFFIGARTLGDLLDMHWTSTNAMLRGLEYDGLLICTERGKGRKASRFRMPRYHRGDAA